MSERLAPLAVTVTAKQPGRYVARAREKAAAWGLPYVEREKKSALGPLFETRAAAFLVLGGDGWTLTDREGELRCTPGMAAVRIKRLQRDPEAADDGLLRFAELQPGDSVLDGTLGLGTDALVCAYRVGSTGRVIGCEASLALWALASEGLPNIDVRRGTALEVLKTFPDHSLDVITLDPMFDHPRSASPAFEILRRYALHEPLDQQTLDEARRVAKRWVVVKAGRYGKELQRLGLTAEREIRRGSPVLWARCPPR